MEHRNVTHAIKEQTVCLHKRWLRENTSGLDYKLAWGEEGGVFQHSHPPLLSSQFQHRNPAHAQQRPNPNPRPPPNPGARVSVSVRTQLWKRGRKLERSALLHQDLTKVIQHRNRSDLQEFKTRSISNDHIADRAVVLPWRQMLIKRFLESAGNCGGFSPG